MQLSQLTGNIYVLIGGAVIGLLIVLMLVRVLTRGKARPAQESGVKPEHLADYPPPPPAAQGGRRLTVEGNPARLRLVVVAPIGREQTIDAANVEALLDQVLKGLGAVCRQDKPRVRVWPAQLSNKGFAPTFHRLVESPDPDGQPSHWLMLAGQTSPRPRPILLGLACWADEPNTIGKVIVQPDQWPDLVRFQ